MSLETGQLIDEKYRILRLIGSGGMGSVYEGENIRIHRKVAIKVLHASVAAKPEVVQRFEREAQAAGRIGSEHIVEVLDLGSLPNGERYMVMEYLEGESLGDRIKHRRRLEPKDVAPVLVQMLEGLAGAHDAGIIHRDLKPDNVFLCQVRGGREFVKVLDFGVSKFNVLDQSQMSMTSTGAVMGTPYYMSPEQARGAKVDARSDIYSVGVVVYQAVTGRVPFDAETFNELVFKIALEAPLPVEQYVPGIDAAFSAIMQKAMARDPAGRYQSCREMQAAVLQWIQMQSGAAQGPHAAAYASGGYPAQPMGATPAGPFGGMPMTTPTGGLGASGPGLSASQPGLNSSQPGLSITGQPQRNGGKVALVVIAGLLVGGGALAAGYVVWQQRAEATAALAATAAPTVAPTSAPTATGAPEATAAPTAEATAAPTAEPVATAVPTAAPTATAAAGGTPVRPSTTAVPTGTGSKPPGGKPSGRVIGGDL